MTCFRARHGKMSLNSIYTSNHMIFRGVSLENVIKFHVHIKLHVCFFLEGGGGGAGHWKMSLNSICTANYMIFRGASLENVFKILCTHQITCFFFFLGGGGRHGENVIEFHIHVKLHIFRCTSWENVIKFHAHVK